MRINKYSIILLFSFIFLQIKATGLSDDIIYINGEEWRLMAKPIDTDSTLYARLRDFLPENHCVSTANWNGYTAFWEIRHDYLYLRRMEIRVYDKTSQKDSTLVYNTDALKKLFVSYYEDGEIPARWFSGELRAGQGDLVRYVHIGFDRNMATEMVMRMKDGKVLKSDIYHNYKNDGLNLSKAQDEIIKRFPWKQFPEYKGQRLSFFIGNFQMTNDGHLLDLDVYAIFIRPSREEIKDGNHPLAVAFKETLKSIYPWETLFINGRYTVEYPRFVMPIYEKYLIAHTTEAHLEVGVPVCYLNERGDTIIPYGKYKFCHTDTIRTIGFVYENKTDARIVCVDTNGRKLFNVFKYDNGADYVEEGLFRITDDNGLIGFADTSGVVIIKPQFKFAFPFKNGKTKVTSSGEFEEWFYINKHGQRLSTSTN
ncbi:WG repeat-containing protein [uncultured Parabacteroides sp.]|uniref:WG repeat-containing protein n=1 Tax=uncultured Parabacteroides sp. TaxID=512312 RepID=UPI002623AC1C|nr:WG repeat-containing protein [uncultured Parabacteroides sp.]